MSSDPYFRSDDVTKMSKINVSIEIFYVDPNISKTNYALKIPFRKMVDESFLVILQKETTVSVSKMRGQQYITGNTTRCVGIDKVSILLEVFFNSFVIFDGINNS